MSIILCGPTCSGKTTIANRLEEKYGYRRIVTYTTRKPRPLEFDGMDYFFLPEWNFNQYKDLDILFAISQTSGHQYGVLRKSVGKYEKEVIVLDPIGVRAFKDSNIPFDVVFLNPDPCILLERAEKRGDDKSAFTKRYTQEKEEFSKLVKEGYCNFIIDITVDDVDLLIDIITSSIC